MINGSVNHGLTHLIKLTRWSIDPLTNYLTTQYFFNLPMILFT